MKKRNWILCCLLFASLLFPACDKKDKRKGACVPKANPLACGNNVTKSECDLVNGKWYPDQKC